MLARAFRVYAPDTVGQSVRSAQTYISPAGNDYGYWLVDVLDGLGLASVPFVSSSFGSGIFLAGEDIFFPAERVAPRARRIFPLPPVIEPIPGGHLSSQQTRTYINRRIVEFLKQQDGPV